MPDRHNGLAGHPLGGAIAGILLFVIGLGLGIGTLQIVRKERAARHGLLRSEGTVVGEIRHRTPEGPASAPLIAFVSASGERVSFTAKDRDSGTYPLGVKVPVLYPLENPADAQIDHTRSRWIRNAIGGGVSLLLISLGAYVAWYARRWDAARQTNTHA